MAMTSTIDTAGVSREKLLHALYEAAELEHNLMCIYLYAAFSLKDEADADVSPEEAEAFQRWKRAIIAVAVEEMGHLTAVWNITAALGGAPHFGRTNFPIAPGFLPAGIVVKLAPFNLAVLQHFVFLERPEGSSEPDGPGFEPEIATTRPVAAYRLTPSGYDYDTVGSFYLWIEEGLKALVSRFGEAAVFCGDPTLQLTEAESRLPGLTAVTDLASALDALKTIVEQGEGAPAHTEDSHFHKFLVIRDEFNELTKANPSLKPAHPAAHNPVLRKPPNPEGRVWLEDSAAIETVDLANAVYSHALRLLAASYGLSNTSPTKAAYVDASIGLMHSLEKLAQRAARLPAGPSNPDCNAGVSFTVLRDAGSLPPNASTHQLLVERAQELAAAAAGLDMADPRAVRASEAISKVVSKLEKPFIGGASDAKAPLNSVQAAPAPVSPREEVAVQVTDDGIEHSEGRNIDVSFDAKRCIHGRICVTQAPVAFMGNVEGAWIVPDALAAEDVAAAIRQCPSGALTYHRHDGHDETAPPINLIATRENGPYGVRADMVLDGAKVGYRATLCRCGASKRKPFCDKSHEEIGFIATGEPATKPGQTLEARDGLLEIDPETNGPLHVTGNLEIVSGTGRKVTTSQNVRLCRCGGSANKPFCDGTHMKIGFKSE
jgi:CDGSH-type Zn-finger protein/uncharacterized Fe-S cluster protein YjdI